MSTTQINQLASLLRETSEDDDLREACQHLRRADAIAARILLLDEPFPVKAETRIGTDIEKFATTFDSGLYTLEPDEHGTIARVHSEAGYYVGVAVGLRLAALLQETVTQLAGGAR